MRRNASSALTAALLVAAAVLVAVAVYLAKTGGSRPADGRHAGSTYAILAGPFESGVVRGRLVTGTAAAAAAASGFVTAGPECRARSVGEAGGLADGVVYLSEIRRGKAPVIGEIELALDECGFTPRVAVGLEGGTARIRSRGAGHRLQAYVGQVRIYDSTAGGNAAITLSSPGPWSVRCAAGHPWEEAWMFAGGNPYHALSDARGRFEMAQVPAGHWTLAAWHPVLGETRAEVDVMAGKTVDVELRF